MEESIFVDNFLQKMLLHTLSVAKNSLHVASEIDTMRAFISQK